MKRTMLVIVVTMLFALLASLASAAILSATDVSLTPISSPQQNWPATWHVTASCEADYEFDESACYKFSFEVSGRSQVYDINHALFPSAGTWNTGPLTVGTMWTAAQPGSYWSTHAPEADDDFDLSSVINPQSGLKVFDSSTYDGSTYVLLGARAKMFKEVNGNWSQIAMGGTGYGSADVPLGVQVAMYGGDGSVWNAYGDILEGTTGGYVAFDSWNYITLYVDFYATGILAYKDASGSVLYTHSVDLLNTATPWNIEPLSRGIVNSPSWAAVLAEQGVSDYQNFPTATTCYWALTCWANAGETLHGTAWTNQYQLYPPNPTGTFAIYP